MIRDLTIEYRKNPIGIDEKPRFSWKLESEKQDVVQTNYQIQVVSGGRLMWDERLVGSGGMPSSHSATVCGMTTAAALHYGVGSFEFAVCFILSMVVMYDAMGVRRETGKQAKLLNSILLENPLKLSGEVLQEKLKEYVGHTPLQVAAGAILGIALAVFMAQYY